MRYRSFRSRRDSARMTSWMNNSAISTSPKAWCSSAKLRKRLPCSTLSDGVTPRPAQAYPWIVRSTAMVNHYYLYCWDRDFGPFFPKFCSYFPYDAKLCLNGHEYAKQQLRQEEIEFQALDNGFVSCADAERLQATC